MYCVGLLAPRAWDGEHPQRAAAAVLLHLAEILTTLSSPPPPSLSPSFLLSSSHLFFSLTQHQQQLRSRISLLLLFLCVTLTSTASAETASQTHSGSLEGGGGLKVRGACGRGLSVKVLNWLDDSEWRDLCSVITGVSLSKALN